MKIQVKEDKENWQMDTGVDGAVIYDDNGTIANIPIDVIGWKARAQLLATAPELLKICQDVLKAIYNGEIVLENDCYFPTLEPTILKALGKKDEVPESNMELVYKDDDKRYITQTEVYHRKGFFYKKCTTDWHTDAGKPMVIWSKNGRWIECEDPTKE